MAEFQGHLNKTFTAEEFSITFRKTVPLPLPTTGPVPSYLLLYLCTLPKYVLMHSFPIPVLPVWWHWHLHTYKAFQAVSTRLWPSLFFFFFFFFFIQVYVIDEHKKNDLQEFSDFFEYFSGSNGRNRREIRAVIDSFETYTINSLMKKKIFATNSIISRALFW